MMTERLPEKRPRSAAIGGTLVPLAGGYWFERLHWEVGSSSPTPVNRYVILEGEFNCETHFFKVLYIKDKIR